MPVDTIFVQAGIIVAFLAVVSYVLFLSGWKHFYDRLSERFIYGVPWGTLLTMIAVVAFYLFAQSGLTHWTDPAVIPFRSWSYSYLTGMLTAGFAHAGVNHLVGNMIGTLVLAPIAEYAWGHYPPSRRAVDDSRRFGFAFPPPSKASVYRDESDSTLVEPGRSQSAQSTGVLDRPWIRALVIFPAVVFLVSVLTSFFALGWSLGFSGTVFVFLGFAVVVFPLTTIVSMVVMTGVNVLFAAFQNPVLTATADPGGPSPPAWAGVNVQAHLLGFLIGVVLALTLLKYRNERPDIPRLAAAVVLVVLARQLWALSTASGDRFVQYRGIGVIFMFALTLLVLLAVAADDRPVLDRSIPLVPDVRTLALLWSVAVVLVSIVAVAVTGPTVRIAVLAVAVATLAIVPVAGAFAPTVSSPVTTRQVIVGGILLVTVIVAAPSIATNMSEMADDPVPGDGELQIEDYVITYEEDAPHARVDTNSSGVIVVSEKRGVWTADVNADQLEHRGETTVTVGGVGWRESVTANRTGWTVDGNESVYVVDLEHEDERIRSFESPPKTAESRIANHSVQVHASEERFFLRVTHNGEPVGDVPIPAVNESTTLDNLTISTVERDGTARVLAEQDGTRVLIAEH